MSDETLNMIWGLASVLFAAGLGFYMKTDHYQQHMPWIGKKVCGLIVYAVARMSPDVETAKRENTNTEIGYDLTPEQGRAAMLKAKNIVRQEAMAHGLSRALPSDTLLEAEIETEVLRRKAARTHRVGPAGKGR